MMVRILAVVLFACALAGCKVIDQAVGPRIDIPARTQHVLAVQSSQAELCEGLAQYLQSLPDERVGKREKDDAMILYNTAYTDNNSVITQIQMAGDRLVVDEALAKKAIGSLVKFREFAEGAIGLSKTSPIDPDVVLKDAGQTRDGGVFIAGMVLGALRAAEWWYAERARAREAIMAQFETFRMKPWHELPPIKSGI